MEDVQRKLDELEGLVATYPEDGAITFETGSTERLETLLGMTAPSLDEVQDLGYISIRFTYATSDSNRVKLSLLFQLPANYPTTRPQVVVRSFGIDASELERVLENVIDEGEGQEVLFLLVVAGQEFVYDSETKQATETSTTAEGDGASSEDVEQNKQPIKFGRRLIYSHHIISQQKRKVVAEWAVELGLGGYSKIGWPGIIVVEGLEDNCQEYVSRLQGLRWKHIVVRGEQVVEAAPDESVDDLRQLHHGFMELGEKDMDKLAAACRKAGLEDLFMTSMKVYA